MERLKLDGYWVRGVDIKPHDFRKTLADEFLIKDLRNRTQCFEAFSGEQFDIVFQLAADMGGMGFIHSEEIAVMRDNVTINTNMLEAAAYAGVETYFFSSSVCVYPDMEHGAPAISEEQVYPAFPDNEYGWEKLYSERIALTYARKTGLRVRVARFENCYGPFGTWRGGREKAPAALCRKVAEAEIGGSIDVWGDGTAERPLTYVTDMIDGILLLCESDVAVPVNLGSEETVTVEELAQEIMGIAKRPDLTIHYVEGPVGVASRNFSKAKINELGWQTKVPLRDGLSRTYHWIAGEVERQRRD